MQSGPTFLPNGSERAVTVGRLRTTCGASGDKTGKEYLETASLSSAVIGKPHLIGDDGVDDPDGGGHYPQPGAIAWQPLRSIRQYALKLAFGSCAYGFLRLHGYCESSRGFRPGM